MTRNDERLIEEVRSVASGAYSIASAITANAAASHDAAGGTVSSLTEAIMGVTAGLVQVAETLDHLESVACALNNIARAIREMKGPA